MIEIGKFNTLTIARGTSVGLYLTDGTTDVLLPNKYVPEQWQEGEAFTAFVYLDQEERPVATTLEPYIKLNDFALLRVSYVNNVGAFMNWGLEKDLFVPFREQARPMEQGKRYLVHMHIDEKSNRLVGSSKLNQFIKNENLDVTEGDEVDLIVSHFTDLGINVIINGKYKGLMYQSEVYDDLRLGDRIVGYVKTIRPDNKIDVTLQKPGFESIEPNAEKILDELVLPPTP